MSFDKITCEEWNELADYYHSTPNFRQTASSIKPLPPKIEFDFLSENFKVLLPPQVLKTTK